MFRAREIRDDDLATIMRWRMDPEITKWMNTDPVLTLEGQKKWLESISQDPSSKYWLIEVDGVPAGVLSLFDIDGTAKSAEWGYYIGERDLRSTMLAISIEKSLYDYCFTTIGLETIENKVLAENVGVIKLHEICGSVTTEVKPNAIEKNGVSHDQVCMEITREKWQNAPSLPYEKMEL